MEAIFFSTQTIYVGISGRTDTRNPGFGYSQYRGEIGLGQVEQGFSSFFAKKCVIQLA